MKLRYGDIVSHENCNYKIKGRVSRVGVRRYWSGDRYITIKVTESSVSNPESYYPSVGQTRKFWAKNLKLITPFKGLTRPKSSVTAKNGKKIWINIKKKF